MKKDNWVYKVFLMTFFLSIAFSTLSNVITAKCNNIIMFIIIIIVITLGIIFDMIGTAALTSNEASFHAKSSRKIKGAKESIGIIKNSVKVSSVCNDVIGDVCGIISGGLGTIFAISLSNTTSLSITISSILVSAIISSLTVGGKAIFKGVAARNCDNIVFLVGKIKSFLKIK